MCSRSYSAFRPGASDSFPCCWVARFSSDRTLLGRIFQASLLPMGSGGSNFCNTYPYTGEDSAVGSGWWLSSWQAAGRTVVSHLDIITCPSSWKRRMLNTTQGPLPPFDPITECQAEVERMEICHIKKERFPLLPMGGCDQFAEQFHRLQGTKICSTEISRNCTWPPSIGGLPSQGVLLGGTEWVGNLLMDLFWLFQFVTERKTAHGFIADLDFGLQIKLAFCNFPQNSLKCSTLVCSVVLQLVPGNTVVPLNT